MLGKHGIKLGGGGRKPKQKTHLHWKNLCKARLFIDQGCVLNIYNSITSYAKDIIAAKLRNCVSNDVYVLNTVLKLKKILKNTL